MIYYLNLFGTAVFAIGGGLAASRKGMDLFGVAVAAVLTGIGGGTLRDLCLGVQPVNWVTDPIGPGGRNDLWPFDIRLCAFQTICWHSQWIASCCGRCRAGRIHGTGVQHRSHLQCRRCNCSDNGYGHRVGWWDYTRRVFGRNPIVLSQGDICYCEPCWWRRISSFAGFRPCRNLGRCWGERLQH